jgi:hypothetical protein
MDAHAPEACCIIGVWAERSGAGETMFYLA